jgi:UDP-GlcNAc:undecaprenyl-phosphate GlcNAc-1-phosphate transferase
VAITNTINLVDGVDGLAAGISAIASLCIAYVAYIFGYYPACFCLLAVAGGALGFLPYNFYPAKTFMGDGGALFLGFMIANFSILEPVKRATLVAVLIPALVLALPIFDTLWAILRRKLNGKSIMEADKEHIHHRLLRTGMGQRRTVLCMYGVCGIMGVAAVLLSRELYVESLGLLAVAATFVLVVLTDMNDLRPRIRKGGNAQADKAPEKPESGE